MWPPQFLQKNLFKWLVISCNVTLSYFICVFSERKREELELMSAEWDPGRGTAKRRSERRSSCLQEEHGSPLCVDLFAVPFLPPSEHHSTTWRYQRMFLRHIMSTVWETTGKPVESAVHAWSKSWSCTVFSSSIEMMFHVHDLLFCWLEIYMVDQLFSAQIRWTRRSLMKMTRQLISPLPKI